MSPEEQRITYYRERMLACRRDTAYCGYLMAMAAADARLWRKTHSLRVARWKIR